RAVFDHSWRLLSEQERALFCHVAVFRGSWTAASVVQVAGATLPFAPRRMRSLSQASSCWSQSVSMRWSN
ncbi:MAG TPA: hypothetical protein VFO07_00335, partial [Roseiflexaceae bacterium]|nr:hypothetical protein [Roseiflexaceae bacterium]